MKHPAGISIQEFTYELPPEKIAVYPLAQRDASKLLVFKNGQISQSVFKQLDHFLEKNSVLVFNNTRVIQARLNFLSPRGKNIEVFCLEPGAENAELSAALSQQGAVNWNCLVGGLKGWKEEDALVLETSGIQLQARQLFKNPNYVSIAFSWEPRTLSFAEVLEAAGNMPIPPYLKRPSEETDALRYQTVYAQKQGSVAAPTAGLHFTDAVFKALGQKEIDSLTVALHVGAGTFKPVKSDTMQGHEMHAEWIEVESAVIEKLLAHSSAKIIAVGTTSFRTLESLYWMGIKALANPAYQLNELEVTQWEPYEYSRTLPGAGESLQALLSWMKARGLSKIICKTRLLVAPPYELRIVSGIITNFHQPQSTLLLLISAVVGPRWKEIYRYALENGFRFLSYGDSSLLLK